MEAAAILEMVVNSYKEGFIIGCIISDDDNVMRAHLKHKKDLLNNDDKGKLPNWCLEPIFKADPSHRIKVIASKFYELARKKVSESRVDNKIARRMKKYWGYMIAQCKRKSIQEFINGAKAPLEHLFDNHSFCGDWCLSKKAIQDGKTYSNPEGYLSKKIRDTCPSMNNLEKLHCIMDLLFSLNNQGIHSIHRQMKV